jgi:O-antigen ligase
VTSSRGFIESWWRELPHATAAWWASLFFSLHVLTLLISLTASQAFLAAATLAYLTHLLHNCPVARASRPLWRGHPARARERDAPATAGGTPALQAISFLPVKLPLLFFCLATFNSILWAEHPAVGWVALRKLVLFLILLLSVNLVATARHLGALFRGLFFVAALTGLVGIAQFVIQYHSVRRLHHDRVYFYMTLTRTHGFMGHWMNFGGQQMLVFTALLAFLLLSASVAKGFLTGQDGKGKGLYWLLLAVVATSLVLNFTRGVWLGCVVATLYIVARWKPRTLWAIPVLLVVAYLAAPSLIRRRVSLAFHPREDPALAIRLEMWGAGLRMVREHPWVGVGPGNIPLVYAQYLPPGTTPMAGYHDHLHDNFLQLAAERGLPCLISWLWFMLALGWHILRIRRRLSSRRWVADAAFAAWLAFLAEGFFEFNFGTSPVLMVFLFVMSTPFIAQHLESRTKESSVMAPGEEVR